MQLAGRKALVTGAQQGIGRAVAIEMARAGADVAVHYLDDEAAAAAVVAEIEALGRRAALVQGDVAVFAALEPLVAAAEAALGGLDILVNNAGVFPRQPFLELTESTWDTTIDINLKATCFLSQAAARRMVKAGRGSIINIASVAMQGFPRAAHYSASKGGVVSFTRGIALELASAGIRANSIAPGFTDTAQPRGGNTEDELQAIAATFPIPRMARPDEIATIAVFLASEASSYMTGQTVHVNGGTFMP